MHHLSRTTLKLTGLLLVSVVAFLTFTNNAHATTFTVSTTDEVTGNSSCSLREAIGNINNQDQTHTDCPEADGVDDTINIPAGELTLYGSLNITESVIIQGQSTGETILIGGSAKVINVNASNTTLQDFSINGWREYAIEANDVSDLIIERVEIDGTDASPSSILINGIFLDNVSSAELRDVYIHSISWPGLMGGITGIAVYATHDVSSVISITNTTVANLSSADSQIMGIAFLTGLSDSSLTPASIEATLSNVTIADLNAGTSAAVGVAAVAVVNDGNSAIDMDMRNTTIGGLSGTGSFAVGDTSNIAIGGAALGVDDSANVAFDSTNNILLSGGANACLVVNDVAPALGAGSSAGSVNASMSSSGGNLSDDTTCQPYFTQPTDQNNIGNLSSTLGTLSDNGGYVPTIPLLAGSPAIDAGVNVSGLTTDARGISRPQLTAYDSGAYEVTQAELDAQAEDESKDDSLAQTGQSQLWLMMLSGLIIVSGAAIRRYFHA